MSKQGNDFIMDIAQFQRKREQKAATEQQNRAFVG